MDLVVDHVAELEHVGRTHGDGLAELLARTAIVELGLAALVELRHELGAHMLAVALAGKVDHVLVGTTDDLGDLVLLGAVKDGRRGEERAGDVLVGIVGIGIPAASGRPAKVALEQLAHVHTGGDAQRVEDNVDGGAVGHVGHVLHGQDLADNALVAVATGDLVALLDLTALSDVDAHLLVHAGGQVVAVLAREANDVDDATIGAVRHLEGSVANVMGLSTEDGTQQALFGGKGAFALGRDLANQDVARAHLGADADNAVLVEVRKHVLGEVRNLAGDLLGTEFGVASVDLVAGDVDGGQQVLGDQALRNDDTVLVVEAFPRHVSHGEVLAEGELGVIGGRTIGDGLLLHNRIAHAHERAVVDAGGLV